MAAFTKWEDSIRKTGVLTLQAGQTASGWSSAIATAIMRFNALSVAFGVKLKDAAADSKVASNVLIETTDGQYSYDNGSKAGGTGTLDRNGNKGVTVFKAFTTGIERAYIFLPKTHSHKEFMKICMVVHEFCHATGVHEHSALVKPDIFAETLSPSGDKVFAGVFNSKEMPPIWMSVETGKKIKDCWS
jgi:hypothetical protein